MELREKIEVSLAKIREFYLGNNGNVGVSFSGGKDSTVLLHLCRSIYPGMVAVFVNTTNEYKENIEFVRSYDNVVELRPSISFYKTIKKYGYPLISKEQSQYISEAKTTKSEKLLNLRLNGRGSGKNGKISEKWKYILDINIKVSQKCCHFLKKKPMNDYQRSTGIKYIIGMRGDEGSLRKQIRSSELDDLSKCKSDHEKDKLHPIIDWSNEDVDQYVEMYDIKLSEIYYDQIIDGIVVPGEKRTGCQYCLFGAQYDDGEMGRLDRLYLRDKEKYFRMMDTHGFRKAANAMKLFIPDDNPNLF